ncbi:hypothetical protein JVX93_09640 [Mycolicibacterium boenickei]|nr:hypothetical protein JVX93_09640 [Mycolicibacterium boenickei]
MVPSHGTIEPSPFGLGIIGVCGAAGAVGASLDEVTGVWVSVGACLLLSVPTQHR